jgi:two-component system, response regulator YesN
VLEMLKLSNERGILPNYPNDEDFLWETISTLSTLKEIENYTLGKITTFFRAMEEIGSRNSTISDIIKFIVDNLSDENLSIKAISDYSYLTQTYLCAFFKKETGKTIIQFINEKRVEKSMEFLKDKQIKLFTVSCKVGYSDPNYYAKVFKKIEGCSPSEFRERYKL